MSIFKLKYKKLPDEKLMEYIQRGNTLAFNELYKRYSHRLIHYFFRMLGADEEKAQDLLQDIFLRIVEKPILFRPEQKFSTWIFAVAHNLCKNEYRRKSVRSVVENNPDMDLIQSNYDTGHRHAEQNVDENILKEAISSELSKIDTDHRSVFMLRHQQNLSIKEISNVLNIPEGTIKSRLYYTTKRLADRLKAYNPNIIEV